MYKSASRFMQHLVSKKNKSRSKGKGWGLKPKQKPKKKAPAKPGRPLPGIKWEPSIVTQNVAVVSQAIGKRRTKRVQVEHVPRSR
jgi:hypothetical protein